MPRSLSLKNQRILTLFLATCNLQTYELGLTKIEKGNKSKSMALKAKSNETSQSFDDEDSKMKSYITRQFKKFMKNINAKGFDKDRK